MWNKSPIRSAGPFVAGGWIGMALSCCAWLSVARGDEAAGSAPAAGSVTAAETATQSLIVPPEIEPTLAIDFFVANGWQRAGIEPSPRCDDATFVRRLYLDVLGRIPTPRERAEFLAQGDSHKRETLIDNLLIHPESGRHLAELFDVMLLGRPGRRMSDRRSESGWHEYLTESFQKNRPWNLMARDMVVARATDATDVRAGWFLYERRNEHQAIAEAVAPSFFGIRIECAQCHDHPLASEIYQSHYWGLVAFFNRGKNEDTTQGPRVIELADGGFQKYTDLGGDSHDTQLTFFQSPIVPETPPAEGAQPTDDDYVPVSAGEPRVPKFSRRQRFADDILSEHPLVARAFVNRIWALLLGRGLVHPYDRMDSTHPASHPELLDWLANDFRASGYDVRRLLRSVLRSKAYQLDSRPNSAQVLPEHFAHALAKPLAAEVLARSIYVAVAGEATEPSDSLRQALSEVFPDVLPEEESTRLSAALLLTNQAEFNTLISGPNATTINEWVALPSHAARVEAAFRQVFGRDPDEAESTQAVAFLEARDDVRAATVQLVWAMLTSSEFYLNH